MYIMSYESSYRSCGVFWFSDSSWVALHAAFADSVSNLRDLPQKEAVQQMRSAGRKGNNEILNLGGKSSTWGENPQLRGKILNLGGKSSTWGIMILLLHLLFDSFFFLKPMLLESLTNQDDRLTFGIRDDRLVPESSFSC